MENIKWKDEIYARDAISVAKPEMKALLILNTGLLAMAIGKTEEEVLNLPYAVFMKLFGQFAERYGLAGLDSFLGKK